VTMKRIARVENIQMKMIAALLLLMFVLWCSPLFLPLRVGAVERPQPYREGAPLVSDGNLPPLPLEMSGLRAALSRVRGTAVDEQTWPRTIHYTFRKYDFKTHSFRENQNVFTVNRKPMRIIPHSVGVSEILWAICPRERIIAFNELSADTRYCLLADQVKESGRVIRQKQTEMILALKPDLVLAVSYSDAAFKKRLIQANISFLNLGFLGTVENIKEQILLIGRVIGEAGNARALVELMDDKIDELRARLPETAQPPRVLFYDEKGYVPGRVSNFNAICELIGVVNVGAEQGVQSWSQIDYEILLKWDPDIIVVPLERHLKERMKKNPLLAHSRAMKQGKIYALPGVYLSVNSQYMILSADLLAGMIYEN